MEVETETGTATQTEEFDYLFYTSTAKPPFDETYFANDNEKVRFYTGLPAYDVLQTVLQQDLAYHFGISIATVSRTFSAWMVVLDARLAFLIRWPEHEDLWQTMPQCFQVAFGNKTTVIIDCFQ